MGTAVQRARKKARVDQAACVACGCCVKVCPVGAVQVVKGVAAQVDAGKCIGCGKCARECPATVITVKEVET